MTTSSPLSPQSSVLSPPSSLLDPVALSKLSRLELVAKSVMDGYVQGMHRSQHIGFALDFAQHRQYAPGDDVKRLDWRLFAKADRYYVKQYEVTTNLRAHVVLDCSGSMKYRGAAEAMSKFRYAQFIAACLGYLVLHQQDAIGLITFDTAVREVLPARSNRNHLMTMVETLNKAAATGEGSLAGVLHEVAERVDSRGMVVLLSDLFDDAGKLIEALHHFRHKRQEVLILQVLSDDELTFPFRKVSEFQNLERASQKLRMDPATMRRVYLDNLANHIRTIRRECGAMRISHVLMNTKEPFDKALGAYLAQRMGGR